MLQMLFKNQLHKTTREGYALVVLVLIVTIIASVTLASIMFSSRNELQASLQQEDVAIAKSLAWSCHEYAMQTIQQSSSTSYTATISLPDGTCDYAYTSVGSNYTNTATASYNVSTWTVIANVANNSGQLTITDIQEGAN